MKRSGFCVVSRPDEAGRPRVLAITRGDKPYDWSFPGGGIEPHESWRQGVMRELIEETGVKAMGETTLLPISGFHTGTHRIRFFDVEGPLLWPKALRSEPFEGWVDLVPPELLLTHDCTFRQSNAAVLSAIGLMPAVYGRFAP